MSSRRLDVPFFTQLDNKLNPHGSCNVTSIAMALWYLGIRGDGSLPQLEDQLYQLCLDKRLSRHSPIDLAKLVKLKGKTDAFKQNATLTEINQSIDNNKPTVIHGYFTRSGHIIECHGYTRTGFICHDPYGDYKDGYTGKPESGKDVFYSTQIIRNVCMPDGQLWLHSIGH
jgi:hypothetical protein